ncbi:aldehyde ferredoxin oxidoreductase N-terminal domain-containing protein [Stetteria hydrogenophila]
MEYTVLRIDVSRGDWGLETIDSALGPVDAGVILHSRVYRSWACDPLAECNALFLGFGPFSLTRLFGANRVALVFRSPVSGGLHVSTLGGAAWAMARAGVHGVALEGSSPEPVAVVVEGRDGSLERVRVEPVRGEVEEAFREGEPGGFGVHRMHELIASRFKDTLSRGEWRILTVGPAAANTVNAGVFSIPIEAGVPSPVVDSASRGGGGSVMLQAHGVAALVMGGSGSPARARGLLDPGRVDAITREVLGSSYSSAVLGKTRKYRMDPKLGTGGTFGVNYLVYRELLPCLAYNTIYYSPAVRVRLHQLILDHFWKPFQEEVFKGSPAGKWRTCGEPCPVACKKIWRRVKVDYEPFHGMGPLIGVLRLPDAARLVELVDSLGLDVIEAGHEVAWVFDLTSRGLLHPSEAGLARAPRLDPLTIEPGDSRVNAELAEALLRDIAYARGRLGSLLARMGLRRAALEVEREAGEAAGGWRPRDLAVYAAFGGEWYMTPNYYWSPGMVAPLYVLGRYWTNYSPTFMEPEDYAETSLKRALWEYSIDNAGMCRFHRGWAESLLPRLYEEAGAAVDPPSHARVMYREIAEYRRRAGAEPVPWESRKTMDLVATIAAEVGSHEWAERIARDPQAALEWWRRFRAKLDSLLAS